MSSSNDRLPSPKYRITRRRAIHACDLCRLRKIRCNGGHPCHTCQASSQDCVYGALEVNAKSKSDVILEGIQRMESTLHGLKSVIDNISHGSNFTQDIVLDQIQPQVYRPSSIAIVEEHRTPRSPEEEIQNAVLSSYHTSTTESVLQWPQFDIFPSLRHNYISTFSLEQSRSPIAEKQNAMYPYLSTDDLNSIIQSFQYSVNFWYPTMSTAQVHELSSRISHGDVNNTTKSSLAFLVLALGCASQYVETVCAEDYLYNKPLSHRASSDPHYQRSRKSMADMYFDSVLKNIHIAHSEMSTTATQCLFLVALYFSFLQRPLQAWQYINATAVKCRLLLSYHPMNETQDEHESLRRIFWSCYILESDYLAELSALPQSGIAEIESSIPLPSAFGGAGLMHSNHSSPPNMHTHHFYLQHRHQYSSSSQPSPAAPPTPSHQIDDKEHERDQLSSLYFLACISMRRLLNRVHNLLYASTSTTSSSFFISSHHNNTPTQTHFPTLVSELDHQLEEWRSLLPASLQFEINDLPAKNQYAAFLRQRYLTCRSVIYRPWLSWVLASSSARSGSDGEGIGNGVHGDMVKEMSLLCLDACLLHIRNLRGYVHTVMIDTWICSLSMTSAMLILLAASQSPDLRDILRERLALPVESMAFPTTPTSTSSSTSTSTSSSSTHPSPHPSSTTTTPLGLPLPSPAIQANSHSQNQPQVRLQLEHQAQGLTIDQHLLRLFKRWISVPVGNGIGPGPGKDTEKEQSPSIAQCFRIIRVIGSLLRDGEGGDKRSGNERGRDEHELERERDGEAVGEGIEG